ncbi:MAG: LLM class flavin-dependent oxidoreductase [Gammaproteobacteria bacterium]
MADIEFGYFSISGDFEQAVAAGVAAEKNGYAVFTTNDHFFSPFAAPSDPQLECFTLLTTVAAKTSRIRIAPVVAAASFRTPPLLAKIASTLDIASGGRLTLGLGSGWLSGEYLAHGYAFPETSVRVEQLGETLEIIKAMWTQEAPSFRGKYFQIENAYNNPRPLQTPHPPLLLGGSAPRLLKLAARHADILNIIPPTGNSKDFPNDPEATRAFTTEVLIKRTNLLKRYAEESGRDPDEITLGSLSIICLSEKMDDLTVLEAARNLGFADLKTAIEAPTCLFGTPAQVREQIEKRHDATGMSQFIVAASNPQSQALFENEVMPNFR